MNKEQIIPLRPFQKEIVENIMKTWQKKGKALISMAVGTGRTITITSALDKLLEKPEFRYALLVTPRLVLCDQFIQTFNKFLKNVIISKFEKQNFSDIFTNPKLSPSIFVTTLATFKKNYELFPSSFFDIIFLDNCDELSEKDWNKINDLKSPLIALTGTHPFKISPKTLSGLGKQSPDFSYGMSSLVLKDLANIILGTNYSTKELSKKGKWKFFRPRDIKQNGFLETKTFISEDFVKKKQKSSLKKGDILLQNIFNFNKMAIVREQDLPALASNNLFIIRSKIISPDVLFEFLQSKAIAETFRRQLENVSHGAVIRRISLKDVKQIPVPLPFSMHQLCNIANIKNIDEIKVLKNLRNELAHLRKAYNEFSEIEE